MGNNEEKERKYKSFIKEMYESIENENRMWAVLFVFYCLFHQFFERKLSEYIVGPFLSTFQDTTVSRLLIIFIILFISLRLHAEWKRHEHISAGKIFMMILVIMTWAYYRFVNQTWIFTEMFASDFLCYIDVVPFYCVGVTVLRIIPHKPVYTPNPNNAFIIDNPIDNKKYDCFGHAQFAESMANKLLDTNISSGAFTLGIVAPWGFGKTSFINMMKKQMENKAIIIDFSPWIYGTDTNLTQAFFTELNKSLRIYNTSLSEDLMAYAELLDGSEMETLNILSRILKKWHKQTLEFRRKKLEETLLNIKQPIVIFIDDLDRLESKEIMEVRDREARKILEETKEDSETAIMDAKYGLIHGALQEAGYEPGNKQDTYQRQQRAPQIDISHRCRRGTPRMLYKPEDKCIIRSGIIF